jgi:hypothetical protein
MFFKLFCSACSHTSCFILVLSVGGCHAEVLRHLVDSLSHRSESSKLPFTVMVPLGPGILSTR